MIYCLSLANQFDIDVSTVIGDKIKKNGDKYQLIKRETFRNIYFIEGELNELQGKRKETCYILARRFFS